MVNKNLAHTPQYLQYLENESINASAHILSRCLSLKAIGISGPETHPQLHILVEHKGFSHHIVRYSKEKWRVYSISTQERDILNSEPDFYNLMFRATSQHDFDNLEGVIKFIET